MSHIRLAISETSKVPSARGFYDSMEDSLVFVIKTRGKFYSYIQGNDYSIDLDRRGRILGLELNVPRENWIVKADLTISSHCEPRQIRILEHRLEVEPDGVYTDSARKICCLRFTNENISYKYQVAQGMIFEVNVVDELSAVWLLDLVEDFGFKQEMEYRKGRGAA